MRILIVEDEKDLNRTIAQKLESEHYNVDCCYDGREAVEYITLAEYDGVILDAMLPGLDGFEVLRQVRAKGIETPVMFLSAKDDIADIVRGLDEGADDYMVKPFSFTELLARLRVMLRCPVSSRRNVYKAGTLTLDTSSHIVRREGKRIDVSPKEYAVLLFLLRNINQVVSREQIEANIWNVESDISSNVVDVYIRHLRKKLDDNYEPKLIQTVRGAGYMLLCEDPNEEPE